MNEKNYAKEEGRQQLKRAQRGEPGAREAFVEENIGLIYMVLKRFQGRGYEMEDLFQIGAIGLLKAIDRFDTEREFAFSTYAVPMIIGEIQRFIRDDGMIHISRQIKENARKISIVREKCKKTDNKEPTIQELQEACGLTEEEILTALEASAAVESIYSPLSGGAKVNENGAQQTLADRLEDERFSEDKLVNQIAVRQLIQTLPEKDRHLIRLRYMEGKTQAQTAALLGMTQVSVSRLEKKVLLQLREGFGYNT